MSNSNSTAELLFNINADATGATANITKFRSALGSDLNSMLNDVTSWSEGVLKNLSSVQLATTAGFAAIGIGVDMAVSALGKAQDKYIEYASDVSKGMKQTGLQAEQMSTLQFAAQRVGVGYDQLSTGVTHLQASMVKGAEGGTAQLAAFGKLGISQKDLIAGEKDLYPLVMKLADGFHNTASATERAAYARDILGRDGGKLLGFLNQGSEGLKKMADLGRQLGMILTDEDVKAVRELKAAQKELLATQQALDIEIGKSTMVFTTWVAQVKGAWISSLIEMKWHALDFFDLGFKIEQKMAESQARMKKNMAAGMLQDPKIPPAADATKIAAAKTEYTGISSILEGLNAKIAAQGDEWDKLINELYHVSFETDKASKELKKLKAEGKITADSFRVESEALAKVPQLMLQIYTQGLAKIDAAEQADAEKRKQALGEAHAQLVDRLATFETQDYAQQRAKLQKEMDALRLQMQKKADLTQEEYDLLDEISRAGEMKIARDQEQAWIAELQKLEQAMQQQVALTLTGQEKIRFEYDIAAKQYSEVEEAKVLKTAQSEAEVAAIQALFAANRTLLTKKYETDLQTLLNSQGWQGVFGNHFASQIKNNEALIKQWASSTNQSLLMVKVTMQELRDMGKQSFEQLAQGMGSGIASAIVYQKSIGDAMRAALASTLESVAGRCLAEAIYSAGLGFMRLAEWDYAGASAAFTAAAIFGSAGVAAAVIGREIAPSQTAASATSSSSSSAPAAAAGSPAATAPASAPIDTKGIAAANAVPAAPSVPATAAAGSFTTSTSTSVNSPTTISTTNGARTIHIHIAGHVIGPSGAAELADILNQAVYENDVKLYASHAPNGAALG